ncbi:hypothetical protein [Azonexus hydrophilus]|uniref:Uncharacterized protein n=1 Tax=Azonexus hydrophilus TaxID=418702 RepID=A0ABZ2XFB1_9RHOO
MLSFEKLLKTQKATKQASALFQKFSDDESAVEIAEEIQQRIEAQKKSVSFEHISKRFADFNRNELVFCVLEITKSRQFFFLLDKFSGNEIVIYFAEAKKFKSICDFADIQPGFRVRILRQIDTYIIHYDFENDGEWLLNNCEISKEIAEFAKRFPEVPKRKSIKKDDDERSHDQNYPTLSLNSK